MKKGFPLYHRSGAKRLNLATLIGCIHWRFHFGSTLISTFAEARSLGGAAYHQPDARGHQHVGLLRVRAPSKRGRVHARGFAAQVFFM